MDFQLIILLFDILAIFSSHLPILLLFHHTSHSLYITSFELVNCEKENLPYKFFLSSPFTFVLDLFFVNK
jgi:hypothetical protein